MKHRVLLLFCLLWAPCAFALEFQDPFEQPDTPKSARPAQSARSFYYELSLRHGIAFASNDTLSLRISVVNPGRVGQRLYGTPVNAAGRLDLTGKWRLSVEKLDGDKVVSTKALPFDAERGGHVEMNPLESRSWTTRMPISALAATAGVYRLSLGYAKSQVRGPEFHVYANMDWLDVRYRPEQTRGLVGEQIRVEFTMTNNGRERFYYLEPEQSDVGLRDPRFAFTAETATGVEAQVLERAAAIADRKKVASLKPGESLHVWLPLLHYVHFHAAGAYTVKGYQDLGFGTTQTDARLVGPEFALGRTFRLELRAPTPREAHDHITVLLQKKEIVPFSALCHPAYLQPLADRLAGKVEGPQIEELLAGIRSIHTTDATRTLLKLCADPREAVRVAALSSLTVRLPDPRDTGFLPPKASFLHDTDPSRRAAALAIWDKGLRPRVIDVAVKGLQSSSLREVTLSSTCLVYMGAHDRLPQFADAAHRIEATMPAGRARALAFEQLEMDAKYLCKMAGRPYKPLRSKQRSLESEVEDIKF